MSLISELCWENNHNLCSGVAEDESRCACTCHLVWQSPKDQKRLALYPKLVEALDYMMGTGYDSTKLTAAEEVLAEAKKLEGK